VISLLMLDRIFMTVVLVWLAATIPSYAGGGGVGFATEATQLLNNGELADLAAKEAEQLATTIKTYELLLKNIERLPEFQVRDARNALINLAKIVAKGQAIAYSNSNIDAQYAAGYRDFGYYEQLQRRGGIRPYDTYQNMYRHWSEVTMDSIRGALNNAGLHAAQFDREASALRAIQTHFQGAIGRRALLQAGGEIAAFHAEQLLKLRDMTAAQIQLQTARAASEASRQSLVDADAQRVLRPVETYEPSREPLLQWGGSIR